MRMQAAVAILCALTGGCAMADPVRNALGYPVDGEIHARQSIPVRAIVSSTDTVRDRREEFEAHELVYQVCNVDNGDAKAKRPAQALYFQWPAAGFRTSALGELPVESCLKFTRYLTAGTRKDSQDVLYTKSPQAVPALTYTMDTQPPWRTPAHYWDYVSELVFHKALLGMKEAQTEFRISATRKSPKEAGYEQRMNWRKGSQLYMVLPRTPSETLAALRVALGRLEGQGYIFSIRAGPVAAQDFPEEDRGWAGPTFAQRDVLRLERIEAKETGDTSSVELSLPATSPDIVELPVLIRDRASGRARYQAVYVTAGT